MTEYHVLEEKTFNERLLRVLKESGAISEEAYWSLKYPSWEEMEEIYNES